MNERLTIDTIVGFCKRRGFASRPYVIRSSTPAGLLNTAWSEACPEPQSKENLAGGWGRSGSAERRP